MQIFRLCRPTDLWIGRQTLRHQFASHLVNDGKSLLEVQQILGHSDPTVTMRYAHLSVDSMRINFELRRIYYEKNIHQDKDDSSSTNARFIPVELFTGAKWDGKHELKLKKVSTSTSACASDSGKRCTTYNITGPFKTAGNDTKIEWAGDEISYYRKTFSTRSFGNVESFFTINNSRDGLVRIYDKRKLWGARTYTGVGNKFPLGYWKQGEVRSYPTRRPTRIEIIELDGPDHCLTFRWTIGRSPFSRNSDNNYTFCPGVGLKSVQHNS